MQQRVNRDLSKNVLKPFFARIGFATAETTLPIFGLPTLARGSRPFPVLAREHARENTQGTLTTFWVSLTKEKGSGNAFTWDKEV